VNQQQIIRMVRNKVKYNLRTVKITINLLLKKGNKSSQCKWLPVNIDINVNFSVLVAAVLN
jgi:hypothetical protein